MDAPATINRFPADALLRTHGWTIVARPNHGEPLWRYGRMKPVPQRKALGHLLRKLGWRKYPDDEWVHASGWRKTFDGALASVLEHEETRPESMRKP